MLRILSRILCVLLASSVVLAGRARAQDVSILRDAEIENIIRTYATPIFAVAGLDPAAVHVYVVNDPTPQLLRCRRPEPVHEQRHDPAQRDAQPARRHHRPRDRSYFRRPSGAHRRGAAPRHDPEHHRPRGRRRRRGGERQWRRRRGGDPRRYQRGAALVPAILDHPGGLGRPGRAQLPRPHRAIGEGIAAVLRDPAAARSCSRRRIRILTCGPTR